jgi:hypothetical protein
MKRRRRVKGEKKRIIYFKTKDILSRSKKGEANLAYATQAGGLG